MPYKKNRQKLGNKGERRKIREGRRNNERELGCGGQNSRFLELTMKDDKKKSKV